MATKRRKSWRPRRPSLKTLIKRFVKQGLIKPTTSEERLERGRIITVRVNVRSAIRDSSGTGFAFECIHRKGKTTSVASCNGTDVLLCGGCTRREKQGGMMCLTLKAFYGSRKAMAARAGK